MSNHHPPQSPIFLSIFLLSLLPAVPASPALPDPVTVQQQTFLPHTSSPPATIPSFPEQSAVAGCPITLPDALFPAVHSSCIDGRAGATHGPLHRSRCCPVLAAWLYSAYAATALGKSGAPAGKPYDMPLLPDDSEGCVDGLETAMRDRGLELPRPNATCDFVYCYCGIRLHQMSCPGPFYVDGKGELAGDERVERLERDCSGGGEGRSSGKGGLARCSKCLTSLYKLNKGKSGNSTTLSERTNKIRSRDCELMGLTWLLAKNQTTYMHTVTAVLRVIMMSNDGDGPGPRSCSLNSDGMPLAVDSSEISGASYPATAELQSLLRRLLILCLMYISLTELFRVINVV